MRNPLTAKRTAVKMTAVVAVLAALTLSALAIWFGRGSAVTEATSPLTVGLDFNTSGTAANGVYNPSSLPTFESCGTVPLGGQASIDLFVLNVQNLLAFESYISYDSTKLKLVGTQVKMFMNSQSGSAMLDGSQNSPDPTTGILSPADTDGLYVTAAADTGNVSGDTGYGVLARLTFQGIAGGQAAVSIPALDQDNNGTADTGATLRADDPANPGLSTIILNDVSPKDGYFDGPFTNRQGMLVVAQDTDGDGFPDTGCPGVPADNCPTVSNPSQADLDADHQGDACDGDIDGDHYWNAQEIAMGSDPNNAASTPEVCDGVDNDADGQIDEGFDYNSNGTPDCSDATADADVDAIMNPSDTDDDNDKFSDTAEIAVHTNTLKKCPVTTNDYFWPADINNDRHVNITDILSYIPYFLSRNVPGDPVASAGFNKRFDVQPNDRIDIGDILSFIPVFLQQCTP